MAGRLQEQRTGLAPKSVTAVLSEDTLVVTLNDALTPAEKALARTPAGAAQVQEFHRQLFSGESESMRREIKTITGRDVRDATVDIDIATGAVVHAFSNGAMVQVFLLSPVSSTSMGTDRGAIELADDDGFRPSSDPHSD
jgi:uncharacterized protein YbcI